MVQKLTKFAFVIFLLSVPFSFVYSLNFIENNKSYTSFPLYNIYLVDIATVFLVIISLYLHKKSFFALAWNKICYISTLIFGTFTFLSFLWSGSPFLSAFWGLRILVLTLSLYILLFYIRNSDFYKNIFFKVFIAAGLVEALIALGQFLFQHSLGLYLSGENHLNSNILGLARVDLLGHSLMRAYGTFPHPNVLGGFLLFTITATLWYKPLKYQNTLIFIQLIGLGLTFSRSAILGLLLVIILGGKIFPQVTAFIKRGTQKKVIVAVSLILFSLFLVRSPIQKILNGSDETINIRLEYAKAAYSRFIDSPVLGRGWGTGPIELPAFSKFTFYSWELQPVHNIYLLVLSDLGIIGFFIFLYFTYRIVLCRSLVVSSPYRSLFIAYLFIGLLDHYLLTLPQGIFIFFMSALLACELEQKTEKTPVKV